MKKRISIVITALFSVSMVFTLFYNNCGQVEYLGPNANFGSNSTADLNKNKYTFSMVINKGAEFTNQQDVTVTYTAPNAKKMLVSTDSSCPGNNWVSIVDNMPYTIPASQLNNTFTLYTKFIDLDDRVTECISDSIIHDNIKPVPVITGPTKPTKDVNVGFNLQGTDNLSGVATYECSVDSGVSYSVCNAGVYSVTNPSEGPQIVKLRLTDKAGNISDPLDFPYLVDRTPPTVVITKGPAAEVDSKNATLEFLGNDATAITYQCKIDSGAFVNCSSPFSYNGLNLGEHTFTVVVTDEVGLTAEAKHKWKIVEGTPSVTITKHPKNPSALSSATFEYEGKVGSLPINKFMCKMDSGNYSPCNNSPKSYNGLTDGQHTFYVYGISSSGKESLPATYTWFVDSKAPTIKVITRPEPVTKSPKTTVVVKAEDENGVDKIICKLDGSLIDCPDGIIKDLPVTDGKHKIEVIAVDKTGNTSIPVVIEWLVDRTPPEVKIVKGPNKKTEETKANFEFEAKDEGGAGISHLMCSLDGQAYIKCNTTYTIENLTHGTHVLLVYAVDKAGNHSLAPQPVYIWEVDTEAPYIEIIQAPTSHPYGPYNDIVEFIVKDGDLKSLQCGLNGNLTNCDKHTKEEFMQLPIGQYTFTIDALDELGNRRVFEIKWEVLNIYRNIIQFVQVDGKSNKVDILFVVDNSGSMSYEQKNMSKKIGDFMSKVKDLDYRIAVTTTDPYKEDGKILPFSNGYVYLNPSLSAEDNQALLSQRIKIGYYGSPKEQGIRNTYRSIQRALAEPNSINGQFFRKEAALAVVLISDEDESDYKTMNKPKNLVDYVKLSFGNSKSFEFHSIITKPMDILCLKGEGYQYGYKYKSLSDLTGGSVGSVCANDYSQQLGDIGTSIKDQSVKTVTLVCEPVDINKDGLADVAITLENGQKITQYQINGLKLTLENKLPVGNHKFEYNCIKESQVIGQSN
jgi:hypothetical protein